MHLAKVPTIRDKQTETALGLDSCGGFLAPFRDEIMRSLMILDEQDAITRGRYFGLPSELDTQTIERIIYYRWQAILFYAAPLGKFMVLPFSQCGQIDPIGRYEYAVPLTFAGSNEATTSDTDKEKMVYIPGYELKIIHEVLMPEEVESIDPTEVCVVIRDYTPAYSQVGLPRYKLSRPILGAESECIPFMMTALSASTSVAGMRVQTEADQGQVSEASRSAYYAALNGQRWVAMTSPQEIQSLDTSSPATSEQYLIAMQSLDNFRLQLMGIKNGGLFQKQAHELQSESDMKTGTSGSVLQDAMYQRRRACTIANSIWGNNLFGGKLMWWMPSESAVGGDMNGDGMIMDDEPEAEGGDEDAVL